ncbi:MAG: hypothetical protein JNL11_11505 [Bdellovibrionaceae bacterium]|nr:hypothetical protein [Pseudobdellovibrionaceae bacterium]
MKTMSTLIFCLLISNLVLATESIQGDSANMLYRALLQGGSVEDCGMGTCGTSVENVSCTKWKGKSAQFICTLKVQSSTGDMIVQEWTGEKAQRLVELLINEGVVNCGMQSCVGTAQSISCTQSNDPQAKGSSECFVD